MQRRAARRPAISHRQASKTQYAVTFADEFARRLAVDLQPDMKGIVATTKRRAVSVTGRKQLDVNFSTLDFGLALGISLNSVHIRERDGRYTHNMKRNEEELRIEALGYHKRQPFAVMVGVLCLPFDSCDDGKRASKTEDAVVGRLDWNWYRWPWPWFHLPYTSSS